MLKRIVSGAVRSKHLRAYGTLGSYGREGGSLSAHCVGSPLPRFVRGAQNTRENAARATQFTLERGTKRALTTTSSSSRPSSGHPSVALEPPALRRAAVLDLVRQQLATHSDAFYVVDLAEVAHKLNEWYGQLPRARPFYAVKCNDDPRIVSTLAKLGAGFDCASKGEMSMALGLGVSPDDIIFAHPAKQLTHIAYARAKGVRKMTFDNEDELRKVAAAYPGAQLVLRILADDSHSVCRLGLKFGCPLSETRRLLQVAQQLGVDVIGISYHVGSGNGNAASFADAVRDAKSVFDTAAGLGMKLRLLDIGGGFPGSELGVDLDAAESAYSAAAALGGDDNPYAKHPSFRAIAAHVRGALDTHFPPGCGVDIISEPGRFFVKSTHTLAVTVTSKRATVDEASAAAGAPGVTRWNYYCNDGLYGSFNCVLYDHATAHPNFVLPAPGTARSEIDLAAFETARRVAAAAAAARASVGAVGGSDDAIALLRADGQPVVSDAVGLAQAVQLAATASTAKAATVRRAVMGGGYVDEDVEEDARMAMGAPGGVGGLSTGPEARATAAGAAHVRGMATTAGPRAAAEAAPVPVPAAFPSTLWGPTCDSIDKLTDAAVLPELQIGDWLVFENTGAYTIAGSCRFNGFPLASKVYRHLDGTIEVQAEEVHA